MRVGTKLTLAVGSVLVLVGIGYGSYYLIEQRRYVPAALERRASELALLLAAAYEEGVPAGSIPRVAERAAHATVTRVEISGPHGVQWENPDAPFHPDTGRIAPKAPATTTRFGMIPGTPLPSAWFRFPLHTGEQLNLVVIATGDEAALFGTRNVDIAVVALVTLVLLLIVSHLSRQNVARPLARLTRTVQRFGEGERSARHPAGEPGEIGELAERFNHMATTIDEQTTSLLREREHERRVVQNISSGVVGLNADGIVTTWNAAMSLHTAVNAKEALGRPLEALSPLAIPEVAVRAARRLLEGRDTAFSLTRHRHTAPRVGERVVDVRGRALKDRRGDLFGAVLAVDDRTEQTRLAEQLQHAEKLATVGQLAAGLAHEIGTPLNVISGRAEFVLKKLPEGDELRRHLERIVAQIDRISSIVQQMLLFARRRPPERRTVAMRELVSGVAELVSHQFEQAGIALRLQVPDDLWVEADPDQIQQVAMNLIINARHALVSGGTVTVSAVGICIPERGQAPFVRLAVADTGPGMDEAVRARIFDPFFTTKEPGKGTGMGLTVCHGIVTAHEGWIEVESAPGKGAMFVVYLPQEAPRHAEEDPATGSEEPA